METAELVTSVLATPAGSDCMLDPLGSPAGPTIRVLFSRPWLESHAGTGPYGNDKPEAQARRTDVVGVVVPEQTLLRIEGVDYLAERLEPVEGSGDVWRTLVLRRAPAS